MSEKKFTKIIDLKGWKVLSDEKYVLAKKIAQTEKYKIFIVKTDKNMLKCADNHILFDENYKEIFAKDLSEGDMIVGKDGLEKVLSVEETDEYENMYDVEVDDDCHRYYTNGILSHNTTTVTAFLLHYILFNFDKKVAVLANKGAMAREILSRIVLGYQWLPKWIQSGVKVWNKGYIELENGCSILASATSSDSVRGSSFSCVTGDTKINVLFDDTTIETVRIDFFALLDKSDFKRYKVLTQEGYKSFNDIRITNSNILYHLYFSDGSELKCTSEHRLLLNNGKDYIKVSDIKPGFTLYDNLLIIDKDKIENNTEEVYDLVNVEDVQSYYTNNVISHNCIFIDECIGGDSKITVRNKKTGEIKQVTMEEFYNQLH